MALMTSSATSGRASTSAACAELLGSSSARQMKAAAFPEFLSVELKRVNIIRPFPLPFRTEDRFKLPERQPTLIADIGSKLKTDSE